MKSFTLISLKSPRTLKKYGLKIILKKKIVLRELKRALFDNYLFFLRIQVKVKNIIVYVISYRVRIDNVATRKANNLMKCSRISSALFCVRT